MEEKKQSYKLILAIMQKMDYDEVASELSRNRIFMTRLSSSGGFLKKENVTAMIGVEEERLEKVMKILKDIAGKRRQVVYTMPTLSAGGYCPGTGTAIPVDMELGGVTAFIMQMDDFIKY